MRRLGSRRTAIYLTLLVALAGSAVIAVSSAQATPTKKNVDAFVVHANPQSQCAQPVIGECFKIQLQNDKSSNVLLGSANFTAPAGWTINSVNPTSTTSSDGHSWNMCVGDGVGCGLAANVAMFRAVTNGDALTPGATVSAYADVTANCALSNNSALWALEAKQQNNFSGTPGNDFQFGSLDLNPLGSFSVSAIADPLDRSVTPSVGWTVQALDTCGQPKSAGVAPGQAAYRGTSPYGAASVSTTGLTGAGFNPASGLNWGQSNGQGTVTVSPNTAEAGNQLTVTDQATGITKSSNTFVVVDELCTKQNGKPCSVNDAQYRQNGIPTTTLSGNNPAGDGFLGLGFDPSAEDGCHAGTGQIGEKMFVYPSADLGNYTVTINYTKAATGKTSPQNVIMCFKGDNTNGWIVLQNCSNSVPPPCVANRSGAPGGGVQIVLSLDPGDPLPIGHH